MSARKCLIPVMGEHGHVNPALAVAQKLVEEGIAVGMFIPEAFRDAALATGAEVFTYSSKFAQSRQLLRKPGDHVIDFPTRIVEECRHVMPQLLEVAKTWKPQLIAYDKMLIAGGMVATKLGIRSAILSPTYAENEQFSVVASRGLGSNPSPSFIHAVNALANEWKIEPFAPKAIFYGAENLNIVFMPRSFQPVNSAFDDRFHFIGPCLSKMLGNDENLILDKPRDTIFVSLGTVFNAWPEFFNICIAALAHTRWKVLMAVGNQINRDVFINLPHNIEVHAFVRQIDTLKQSALFITHGGMNSTMEALHSGVPMVVIPQMPEQEVTASRVGELNLGIQLSKQGIDIANLRNAIDYCNNNNELRNSIAAMQKIVQSSGGPQKAAELLISYGFQ